MAEDAEDRREKAELEIARLWERIYDPGTREILDGLPVRADWRCIELGAGHGSTSRWLADKVPDGWVIALDQDVRYLENTWSSNLTVRRADLVAVDFPPGSFDLVVARAALSYLPDPEAVVARAYEWLAPGGQLIVEDFYHLPSEDSATPLARRVVDGYVKAAAGAGVNWRFARQLPSTLARTGFKDVKHRVRPLGPGQSAEGNELIRARMKLLGRSFVESELVAEADVAEFIESVDTPEMQDVAMLLFSVWGRR
ncbi:class I SAM-dependent methyltransferase [Amycolatopsis sp. H20-H5]|uniref:class I SAM-dependent methyltransferase n=1 Tax=Amycolatopsis sp. H20-H5 TaxID=3046309 RepID=UPI002DB6FD75|nr:class I SAM-dependent methyltransferase [Amycolatopsis sp. H20-H5]MEC3975522.1 class I SAM-dependent methyltransferase [Amycolatopsis sp. H20-H5]